MPAVDVVLCSDRQQMVGAQATIRSLIQNTKHPETIAFHIVVPPGESRETLALIGKSFPRPAFSYEICEFDPSPALHRYIRAAAALTGIGVPHQAAAINCSRFYLCQLFPKLDKIIYLDTDTIVQGDVTELFQEASLQKHDLAAVPHRDWGVPVDRQSVHFQGIDLDSPGFNAGVLVTRLTRWRERALVQATESWMDLWSDIRERSAASLFHFGSQVILILVFRENFQFLAPKWNFCGLGFEEGIPEADLKQAAILHWTGMRKPWLADGLYRELWQKYAAHPNAAPQPSASQPWPSILPTRGRRRRAGHRPA